MLTAITTVTFIIGGIFGGIYLISFRRFLKRLKTDYPKMWTDLGKPEFGEDSSAGALVATLMFLRHKDPKEDADLARAKKQTWRVFLVGVLLMGGGIFLLLLRFIVNFFF
ncbi:MAG: hypothetical protein V3S66_05685 [Desulfobacterales bacterium]